MSLFLEKCSHRFRHHANDYLSSVLFDYYCSRKAPVIDYIKSGYHIVFSIFQVGSKLKKSLKNGSVNPVKQIISVKKQKMNSKWNEIKCHSNYIISKLTTNRNILKNVLQK